MFSRGPVRFCACYALGLYSDGVSRERDVLLQFGQLLPVCAYPELYLHLCAHLGRKKPY